MNRRRIENLESHYLKPGDCPTCGAGEDAAIVTVRVELHGEGEPLGYYYQKPWPDTRRYPYPPDPRPVCPTCGKLGGDMLIITAVYDAAEWEALRKQVRQKDEEIGPPESLETV